MASGFLSISSKKVFVHSFLEELIEKIITNVLAYFVLLSATKKNVFKVFPSRFLRTISKKFLVIHFFKT